jgi:ADP-heptose:LPS heptosyltransferase
MTLLFITSTRIGDAVLSTGLLGHLIEAHPGMRVTVACGALPAPLFQAVPGLERVLVMQKGAWLGHWLRLWRETVATRWRLVVDLRGSLIAYALAAAERRVLGKTQGAEHRVVQLAALFGLADRPPSPRLWIGAEHRARAAALVPAGGPVLALAPAANWRAKTWRAERFAELARALTATGGMLPGARLLVLGAEADRRQAEPTLAAVAPERVIDLVGRIDIMTAAAALARAQFFIGNDSGLMHLAAAAGVPTLGLFGPSPVAHYRPWGPLTAVAHTPESPAELMAAPGWHHLESDSLMDGLTVAAVEAAARDLRRRVR